MKGAGQPNKGEAISERLTLADFYRIYRAHILCKKGGDTMTKYSIRNMRVIFPEGKVAEKRPDLWAVIHGDFFDAKGNPLSINRKEISTAMARAEGFSFDYQKGILDMPSGKRGRKPSAGATAAEIAERIKSLKG